MAAKPMPRIRAGVSGSALSAASETEKHISINNKRIKEDKTSVDGGFDNLKYLTGNTTAAFDGFTTINTMEEQRNNANCEDKNIFGIMSKDLEENEIKVGKKENVELSYNKEEELGRLKQLMMLQTSLISRQQDLLKLRDKEILKLKTTNQALNSRMERMGRRISLSRRNPLDSVNTLSDATSEKQNIERKTFDDLQMTSDLVSSIKEGQKNTDPGSKPSNLSQNVEMCSTPISKPPKKRKKSKNETSEKNDDSTKNITLFSPIKSPSGQNHIPVPISFIERCQNELMSSFTNPLLTKDGVSVDSNAGLKVCERCPHCTVMAAEITQLIMMANNTDLNTSSIEGAKVEHGLSGDVTVEPAEPQQPPSSSKPPKKGQIQRSLLRTRHPYHRQHSFYDGGHFPGLVGWGDVQDGGKMLIPTWRLNEIPASSRNSSKPSTSRKEDTSDDSYMKRHAKFELDEKRRKRWDIQRIREFRYNEKLRKNDLFKEPQVVEILESFLPSLIDIDMVEVNEDIPVSFFGYSLPSLKQSEFKLPTNSTNSKKS